MDRLKNKVAIITGAASGMGFAAAKLFAEEGAKVVAVDLKNTDKIKELNDPNVIAVEMDVSDEEGWKKTAKLAFETFGRIDVLVNNAGLSMGPHGIFDTSEKEWDLIMNVDLKGPWLVK